MEEQFNTWGKFWTYAIVAGIALSAFAIHWFLQEQKDERDNQEYWKVVTPQQNALKSIDSLIENHQGNDLVDLIQDQVDGIQYWAISRKEKNERDAINDTITSDTTVIDTIPELDLTNLVARYDFDGNGLDKQGKHNASATNITYQDGAVFAGENTYFTIADHDDLSFGMGAFTMILEVKFSKIDGDIIVSKRGKGHEYQLGLNASGNLEGTIYSDNFNYIQIEYPWSPSLNTSYEIVWTYDGSETNEGMNFYIDKASVSVINDNKGTFTGSKNTTSPLYLGVYGPIPDNQASFTGTLKYLQLWSEDLKQNKIQAIVNDLKE